MSDIREKLKKLLALARHGIGGEKDNAQALLESLMLKHGVSLSNLGEDARDMQWFKHPAGHYEKRLMNQVICSVCGAGIQTWRNRKQRNAVGVEVTKAEQIEIELLYQAYRPAMAEALRISYVAFLNLNDIFPKDAPKESAAKIDWKEIERITAAMMSMSRVQIRRALPGMNKLKAAVES